MNAHERFVSLMRQALEAYEEAHCGKRRAPRRRGPLPLTDAERALPTDPQIEARVSRKMVAGGWRQR